MVHGPSLIFDSSMQLVAVRSAVLQECAIMSADAAIVKTNVLNKRYFIFCSMNLIVYIVNIGASFNILVIYSNDFVTTAVNKAVKPIIFISAMAACPDSHCLRRTSKFVGSASGNQFAISVFTGKTTSHHTIFPMIKSTTPVVKEAQKKKVSSF